MTVEKLLYNVYTYMVHNMCSKTLIELNPILINVVHQTAIAAWWKAKAFIVWWKIPIYKREIERYFSLQENSCSYFIYLFKKNPFLKFLLAWSSALLINQKSRFNFIWVANQAHPQNNSKKVFWFFQSIIMIMIRLNWRFWSSVSLMVFQYLPSMYLALKCSFHHQ